VLVVLRHVVLLFNSSIIIISVIVFACILLHVKAFLILCCCAINTENAEKFRRALGKQPKQIIFYKFFCNYYLIKSQNLYF